MTTPRDEPEASARFERGLRTLGEMLPGGADRAFATSALGSDFGRLTVEFVFGDIMSRPGLDRRSREIASIAALTALGRLDRLRSHLEMGLHVGLTEEEIVEVLLQMAAYAGFPAAHDALHVAQDVFAAGKAD
jgi:4-carboxymuconolactone decarboxylase